MRIPLLLLGVGCCVLCGCGDSNPGAAAKSQFAFPAESELVLALPPGLTKTEVIARYGNPMHQSPGGEGREFLAYPFAFSEGQIPTNGQYLGFFVALTNGRVAFAEPMLHSVAARLFPSEPELTNAVPLGLSKTELTARFGAQFSRPKDDGTERLTYWAPGSQGSQDGPAGNWRFCGFSVTLTNGKVAGVVPIHQGAQSRFIAAPASQSQNQVPAQAPAKAAGTNVIQLFAVSDQPVPGGRFLDSPTFPKLGYIAATPDLALSELASVTSGTEVSGTSTGDSRAAVLVTLNESGAKGLADLTMRIVGGRLAIFVGPDLITAPVVRSPVLGGSFQMTFKDQVEAESGVERMRTLVRKSQ